MTVETMRELFIRAVKRDNRVFEGYDATNEKTIKLTMNGENLHEIDIFVSFSCMDDGAMLAHIGCYDLPNFANHFEKGVRACNQLNDDEIVKYNIDDEYDAIASISLLYNAHGIPSEFSPEQVLTYATIMATSVDDAYPVLERAKWA